MGEHQHACNCGGGAYSIDFSGRRSAARPCSCRQDERLEVSAPSVSGSAKGSDCGCSGPAVRELEHVVQPGEATSEVLDDLERHHPSAARSGPSADLEPTDPPRVLPIGARPAIAPRLNFILPALPERIAVRAPDGSGAIIYMDRRHFEHMRREAARAHSSLPSGTRAAPPAVPGGYGAQVYYGGVP